MIKPPIKGPNETPEYTHAADKPIVLPRFSAPQQETSNAILVPKIIDMDNPCKNRTKIKAKKFCTTAQTKVVAQIQANPCRYILLCPFISAKRPKGNKVAAEPIKKSCKQPKSTHLASC